MIRFVALNAATLAGVGAALAAAPRELHAPLLGGIGVAWLAAFVRGVAHPASSLFVPVHSRGRDATQLALTLDDGPGPDTRVVLSILAGNGVKATFFPIGENVKGREDVLRAVVGAGHVVGSHSFSHSRLTNFLPPGAMKAEIERGIRAVEEATGKRPRLYRPPVGLKSPSVWAAARALDLVVVGWRRRGRDGGAGGGDPARILDRLVGARGGDVLLLHDGTEPGRTGDRGPTLQALRELLPLLRARGFTFVTVDQLLGVRAYA